MEACNVTTSLSGFFEHFHFRKCNWLTTSENCHHLCFHSSGVSVTAGSKSSEISSTQAGWSSRPKMPLLSHDRNDLGSRNRGRPPCAGESVERGLAVVSTHHPWSGTHIVKQRCHVSSMGGGIVSMKRTNRLSFLATEAPCVALLRLPCASYLCHFRSISPWEKQWRLHVYWHFWSLCLGARGICTPFCTFASTLGCCVCRLRRHLLMEASIHAIAS